eukprot:TRINITY_DN21782_c0_g1_i1.p1 TRINITY_DN21782_c0_g1~~TRINITY_DN21782_c0_g1_i1.p1  ORF type:complete len:664 (+),score=78.59 TRINITY_DN21782_c0_g1_i1:23-1993(+)
MPHPNTIVVTGLENRRETVDKLLKHAPEGTRLVVNGYNEDLSNLQMESIEDCLCCVGKAQHADLWSTELTLILCCSPVAAINDLIDGNPELTNRDLCIVHCTSSEEVLKHIWYGGTVENTYGKTIKCDEPDEDDCRLLPYLRQEQAIQSHFIFFFEPFAQHASVAMNILQALNPCGVILCSRFESVWKTNLADKISAQNLTLHSGPLQTLSTPSKCIALSEDIISWVYTARKPFSVAGVFEYFETETSDFLGTGLIYHVNGTIWLAPNTDHSYTLTGSGGRYEVEKSSKWFACAPIVDWSVNEIEAAGNVMRGEYMDRRQEIVFISPKKNKDKIKRLLDAILINPDSASAKQPTSEDLKNLEKWDVPDSSDEESEETSETSSESSSSFDEEHTIHFPEGKGVILEVSTEPVPYPVKVDGVLICQTAWEDELNSKNLGTSSYAWYERGTRYWGSLPVSLRGVELDGLHWYDVSHSRDFFKRFSLQGGHALDLAGGLGRFAKTVLVDFYDKITLVEGAAHLSRAAGTILKPSYLPFRRAQTNIEIRNCQLQSYNLPPSSFDLVALTWVLMFLTDADVVVLLCKIHASLIGSDSSVFIKENTLEGEFAVNTRNSSTNRCDSHYEVLFEHTGFTLVHKEKQSIMPGNLHQPTAFLLRRAS